MKYVGIGIGVVFLYMLYAIIVIAIWVAIIAGVLYGLEFVGVDVPWIH